MPRIVNRSCPKDCERRRAPARSAIAALPPRRCGHQGADAPLGQRVAEAMAEEGKVFSERLSSPEAREAMTAFFEKRKPDFSRF